MDLVEYHGFGGSRTAMEAWYGIMPSLHNVTPLEAEVWNDVQAAV